ncbi:very long chain fatty acid elongase 7-like [Planococcus citri]|uniref:very long chain fatty acid elongase 7-like n=1 Tax=Planococcus citri TaxID=170843 RepID=UPI0031F94B19
MAAIAGWFKYQLDLTIKDNVYDKEVDSWFLMDNLLPVIGILAAYLLFVLKFGPQWMQNRKQVPLQAALLFYNLAIALFNAYMFTTYLRAMTYPWKYLCVPHPDRNTLPFTRQLYRTCWYYFISKIIELLDTVFFVLRKKQSQVTALHVYHHSSMVLNTWLYLKYLKTEQGIVVGALNTFVHVIMYMYYFLAALGPSIQKYLWWKKYITVMQLTQFAIILTYLMTLLVIDCKVHRAMSMYMFFHTSVFLLMFLNFYRKEYFKEKSKCVRNFTERCKRS